MKNYTKVIKFVISAAAIVAIVYMAAVLLWASTYTVLSADDFSHGVDLGMYREFILKHILGSLFFAGLIYFIWQGTFFSMFLQGLLSPINGYMYPQLKIVMILNLLLALATLLFLIYEVFKRSSSRCRFLMPVISALTIFTIFGFVAYYEVFFWYSGSTSYGYPFSVMMAGLAFTLRFYRLGKKSDRILAKVFGFLAGGGTLMIAGAGCCYALLILIYFSVKNHYVDYDGRRIFKWWFIGALVNTLALGNYARKFQQGSSGCGIVATFKNSVLICIRAYKIMVKNGFILQILLVFLILGILMALMADRVVSKRTLKLLCVLSFISPISSWFACFPATLGYGAVWGLGNRCNFIVNTTFIISTIFAAIVFGYTIATYIQKKSLLLVPVAFGLILILNALLPGNISANKFSELQGQLENGEIQQYYNECKEYVEKLDEYPEGTDVRVSVDEIPRAVENTCEFYNFSESSDPDSWLNVALAKYYGFKSFATK